MQAAQRKAHQGGTGGGEAFPEMSPIEREIEEHFLLEVSFSGKKRYFSLKAYIPIRKFPIGFPIGIPIGSYRS